MKGHFSTSALALVLASSAAIASTAPTTAPIAEPHNAHHVAAVTPAQSSASKVKSVKQASTDAGHKTNAHKTAQAKSNKKVTASS